MKTLKQLTLGATFAIVLSASVLAQCPISQYCPPPPQPAYQPPPPRDPWEETRRQTEAMERAEHERQQQNRPMCTTYHTDPMTGVVKAVTAPCY